MDKVNVVIMDATGNKERKVGLLDDIKCAIIMVKLIEKIKLPSVGPDGNNTKTDAFLSKYRALYSCWIRRWRRS